MNLKKNDKKKKNIRLKSLQSLVRTDLNLKKLKINPTHVIKATKKK